MSGYRWLHLTDLHFRMPGQASLWPNMETVFFQDLDLLHEKVGAWDLVLFTGDLTYSGSAEEFDALERLLTKLWSHFEKRGFKPKLLAIPGNHDLLWPSDESNPALLTLLHNWGLPAVQEPFWSDADSAQRQLLANAFQGFTDWWTKTSIPKPADVQPGVLPGDWAVSIDTGGFKLGVLGLNSAYLQLGKGDFSKRLHLDVQQFNNACGGHGPDWVKQHDACLLLTHHPVDWLYPQAKSHFEDEIHAPPERFALHLFGHMHDANLSVIAQGGGQPRRRLQGCSLFGMETWGEDELKREHGYSLCEIELEDRELSLRVWPRRAVPKQGGGRKLERDLSFTIDDGDGGTYPVPIGHLDNASSAATTPQAPASAPRAPIQPVVDYDPRTPVFHVPFRQKGDQVIGRDEALERVRRQLSTGRRTAIGQTAVFQGLGGLGKTQLAVEYAYRHRGDYPNGVIWLNADQDLDAQLVNIAIKARWVAPESEHSIKLEIARRRVRSFSDCLLIFDNLEDPTAIRGYLPEPPAAPHILVTSRIEQPDFVSVPIDLLDSDQALRLLVQETGRQPQGETEWDAAREIARSLAGLPLALELAGAYLSRRPVEFQRYLELLRYNLKQALPPRIASLTSHEADLFSTLRISEGIFTEEPRFRTVLDVLVWSGPAAMSLDLLAALVGVEEPAELTGALGLGTALRILQREPDAERYTLHRLVREVRREQTDLAERIEWTAEVCTRVNQWFSALRLDFMQLPRFEAEIDHLREWHDHAVHISPTQAPRLAWLQAFPSFHRGQASEVRRQIEEALSQYHDQEKEDQALLAHLKSDLAYSLNELGDRKDALELGQQALSVRRELFGERHPDVARSLNNLASYTDALGDPKGALELGRQALSIQRELFGERHPDVAGSLHNMAGYWHDLGSPHKAFQLAQTAYDIRKQLLGAGHPDTLNTARLLGQINRPGFRVPSSKKGRHSTKGRKSRR
jgi:predicted MPP superfamily phosphohydrolase